MSALLAIGASVRYGVSDFCRALEIGPALPPA